MTMRLEDMVHGVTREEHAILDAARGILTKLATRDRTYLSDADGAMNFFNAFLGGGKIEHFMVAFLDTDLALISMDTMFIGTVNRCSVEPTEIVRRALQYGSNQIIVGHNHPSGDCTPSKDDLELTRMIVDACDVLDINVLDHIVVGRETFSFSRNNLL